MKWKKNCISSGTNVTIIDLFFFCSHSRKRQHFIARVRPILVKIYIRLEASKFWKLRTIALLIGNRCICIQRILELTFPSCSKGFAPIALEQFFREKNSRRNFWESLRRTEKDSRGSPAAVHRRCLETVTILIIIWTIYFYFFFTNSRFHSLSLVEKKYLQ